MKTLLRLVFILVLFPYASYSQDTSKIREGLIKRANSDEPGMTAKEATKHIGSEVYVRDTVYDYKIINRSEIILYVGDRDTKKALNILIKGNQKKINIKDWKNKLGSFSGRIMMKKGKPTISITNLTQLGTRIEI